MAAKVRMEFLSAHSQILVQNDVVIRLRATIDLGAVTGATNCQT